MHPAKLTCAVVPLLLASAVLLGSLPMRSFCSNSRLNALSSSLGIWLHRAVYDETTNSMPEGRLSPLRARNTSETPAIAVTSETIQSGYFRGMVGEVYTGTSWESLPNKECGYDLDAAASDITAIGFAENEVASKEMIALITLMGDFNYSVNGVLNYPAAKTAYADALRGLRNANAEQAQVLFSALDSAMRDYAAYLEGDKYPRLSRQRSRRTC